MVLCRHDDTWLGSALTPGKCLRYLPVRPPSAADHKMAFSRILISSLLRQNFMSCNIISAVTVLHLARVLLIRSVHTHTHTQGGDDIKQVVTQ